MGAPDPAPWCAHLWGSKVSGPVNISDLTVDHSRNGATNGAIFVVGIFCQNSSGTVDRVVTLNQRGDSAGVGIWPEWGSSNPLITIANSSVPSYEDAGIEVAGNSATPDLTAVIRGNEVTNSNSTAIGIDILEGDILTVTGNLIFNPGAIAMVAGGVAGSISANKLVNGNNAIAGINVQADGFSVTSNKIFGSVQGILLNARSVIQSNTITSSVIGIGSNCLADQDVCSNIITDPGVALNQVPSAIASSNEYFNVGRI
jgi:hypothetical protein